MPTLADVLLTQRGTAPTLWMAGQVTAVTGGKVTVKIDNAQAGADTVTVSSVGAVAAVGNRVLIVSTRAGTYSLGKIGT